MALFLAAGCSDDGSGDGAGDTGAGGAFGGTPTGAGGTTVPGTNGPGNQQPTTGAGGTTGVATGAGGTGGAMVTGTAGTGGAMATGTAGTGGTMTTGTAGTGGVMATGTAGTGGTMTTGAAGTGGAAGMAGTGGTGGGAGDTSCCSDGDCICRGEPPASLSAAEGPYNSDSYSLPGVGCIYYPTDAEPPFSAVAISDGFLGSGGCGLNQTNGWGPLYASHGIVAMIIETLGGDQPPTRGQKLGAGIEGFKQENENPDSPIFQQLAGRYGTSGFSMGGGGTSYASADDPTLESSVAIMPWGPTNATITVPTLVICGSSDGIAPCSSHGTPLYNGIGGSTPKMRVTVSSGHNGQPSAGGNQSGAWGLAFQKAFLDGDERWLPVLSSGDYTDAANIQ